MRYITARQNDVLNAIRQYIQENQYAPSIRELGTMVGLRSSSTVHRHLEKLKENGRIHWETSSPRTITIIKGEDVAV